jgi:mannose-1-phosphate guanylyltransferase/phosphomannomutase
VFSDTINSGIFVLEPEIFDHIAPDRPVDFSSEVFPALLSAGKPLFGAVAEGYWEDVGTLDAYVRAHKDVLDGKVEVDIPGFRISDGVWLGEGAEIHPDATVVGPAVIGDSCLVEAGARLGQYAVLGDNVRVRAGADLERVVIHDNVYLGPGVRLRGTTIGRSCDLRNNVRAEEGVVLGDECYIGPDALLGAGVKVFPFKSVEAAAVVNSSIVWESRGARSLFGRDGVAGLANVDISPELAAKLAMAWGTTLKKGSTVITSRDSSRSARMLKRAMMAGLNASGINVLDLEMSSVPVTRFLTRQPIAAGGCSVRLVEDDPQAVVIRFFDERGLDLAENEQRKIERLLNREDVRRVFPGEIGDIGFPPRALEQYTAALNATVDTAALAAARLKVVVDYGYGSTSFVMPNVLGNVGADVLGVNPYANTFGAMAYDAAVHAREVAALVVASGAQVGAVIDPDGEHLTLVDERGRVLSHTQALLAILTLVVERLVGDQVALPVACTSHATSIVEPHGVSVCWTKLSTPALMDAATERGVGFAASLDGGYILPGFLPAYDAAASLVKVLELLALSGRSLADVVDASPTPHLAQESVVTPWDQKGTVMRSLMDLVKGREVLLVDGVKVFHDEGWVLAVPDPEQPTTQVYAEGPTDADAKRLAQEYARRIRAMLR